MLTKYLFTVPKRDLMLPAKSLTHGGYLLKHIDLETASVVAVLPADESIHDYWPHAAVTHSEDVTGSIVDALTAS